MPFYHKIFIIKNLFLIKKQNRKGAQMYERMLDKQVVPSITDMTTYCEENAELFTMINEWLTNTYDTVQTIVFPYGKHYGWAIAHRKKKKLICNIFAEKNAFTVMMRLSDKQFQSIYNQMQKDTQELIDKKYPCGDGGWIHYRVTCPQQYKDIQTLLSIKCTD